MKNTIKLAALAAALLAMLFAGCGGGDESADTASEETPATIEEIEVDSGPFDSDEEFLTATDELCDQYSAIYNRIPIYASFPAGLSKEFEARVALDEAVQEDLESIEPTEGLAEEWQAYVDASAEILANDERIVELAEADQEAEVNEFLSGEATATIEEFSAAAEELGACEEEFPSNDELAAEVASATEAAADAPQSDVTIEAIASEYLMALQNGDCEVLFRATHSQNYLEGPEKDCSASASQYEGYELAATASYGPAAAAVFANGEGESTYNEFILDPKTGGYAYTGTLYAADGGLQPANEGIDSDQVAADAVTAIRDNDPDGLSALLKTDVPSDQPTDEGAFEKTKPFDSLGSDPVYEERIVADIRADSGAEPVLLGADQAQAYYLLDTEATDYVLVNRHEPGSETEYRFSGYWAISE